jgi:hypothetical protein
MRFDCAHQVRVAACVGRLERLCDVILQLPRLEEGGYECGYEVRG